MPSLNAPATHALNVVLSDTTDLEAPSRAIHVGNGGDVKLTMISGDTIVFTNLSIGWHPLRVRRVWDTGTTASDITAVW